MKTTLLPAALLAALTPLVDAPALGEATLPAVPNGEHVMTELIGKGFMQRMERMRVE